MTKFNQPIMLRFTPDQLAKLKNVADSKCIPLAVYVRSLVLSTSDDLK
jgi:hypothetical protein